MASKKKEEQKEEEKKLVIPPVTWTHRSGGGIDTLYTISGKGPYCTKEGTILSFTYEPDPSNCGAARAAHYYCGMATTPRHGMVDGFMRYDGATGHYIAYKATEEEKENEKIIIKMLSNGIRLTIGSLARGFIHSTLAGSTINGPGGFDGAKPHNRLLFEALKDAGFKVVSQWVNPVHSSKIWLLGLYQNPTYVIGDGLHGNSATKSKLGA